MGDFDLAMPATPEEAIELLRRSPPGEVAVLAGGTDLLFDVDDGRAGVRCLVSLRRLPWRFLRWDGPALTVGSTLPLRDLERDAHLAERLPGLFAAVRAVGGVALRHQATLGGNLGRAAPASDLIPMMLALDAEVELVGPSGTRTVSVDRFVRASRSTDLRAGEMIRSVRFPESRPSAYLWRRVRPFHDISQVAVAVAWAPGAARWRVALAGFPPRALLVPEAEAILALRSPSDAAVDEAARVISERAPIAGDKRASEEYRRQLVRPLLARALRAAGAGSGSP